MFQQRLLILLFSFLFFEGCSALVSKKQLKLSSNKQYAIASFWNYTETPMAGLRASTIMESVLAGKNIMVHSFIEGSEEMNLDKSSFIKEQMIKAKKLNLDYLIIGNVQEWRYKTGIDGEPVVSYSIKVLDLKNDTQLFSAVGAKSGWGHKSIGIVAQEIAEELLPQFVQ